MTNDSQVDVESRDHLNVLRWSAGLIAAAILGCLLVMYFPFRFDIPQKDLDSLRGNTVELSALASEMGPELRWKNSMLSMALVGFAYGVLPIAFSFSGGRLGRLTWSCIGAFIGIACGLIAAWSTTEVRSLLQNAAWAQTDDGSPSIFVDLASCAILSMLIAVPTSLVPLINRVESAGQKVAAAPMAGLLTGLLFPLVISVVIPEVTFESIPPSSPIMLFSWLIFLSLMIVILTQLTGAKSQANTAGAATESARPAEYADAE